MARIAGVTIPSEKQVQIALTYIYGIGKMHSRDILAAAKIEPTTRVKDLTEAEEQRLREIIDSDYTTEGDLQRLVTNNIKRLKDVNAYRGFATRQVYQSTDSVLVRMHELVRVKQSLLVAHNIKQHLRRRKGTDMAEATTTSCETNFSQKATSISSCWSDARSSDIQQHDYYLY